MDPSEFIKRLRSRVSQADHLLTPAAYAEVIHLFDACASDPALVSALRARSPEWSRREFLLNVDGTGHLAAPMDGMLADFRDRGNEHRDVDNWLEEGQVDGRPVLLVARWLCHLVGFRHRTVQTFLDHSTANGYTLLQVRGFDKDEAPGCFDMPCAGHVAGPETAEEALSHELGEELGLERSDVPSLQALGCYEYRDVIEGAPLCNVEFRAVYKGRLAAGAMEKMRFVDREVAAVALFATSEVRRLIERAPGRVASGLAGSWGMYR